MEKTILPTNEPLPADAKVSIERMQSLAAEFEKLLVEENLQLEAAVIDGLNATAKSKLEVTNSLSSMESQLVQLLDRHADHKQVQTLRETLTRCRDQNLQNKSLTLLVLKHTNSSLDLLRSLQMMDDLSLYSAGGELDVKREQRHIGSA